MHLTHIHQEGRGPTWGISLLTHHEEVKISLFHGLMLGQSREVKAAVFSQDGKLP